MTCLASAGSTSLAAAAVGTVSKEPAFNRFMLLSIKACALLRHNATSIWSSEAPSRCVRAAIFDNVSPALTRYSSPTGDAGVATVAPGAGDGAAAGDGVGAAARGAATGA